MILYDTLINIRMLSASSFPSVSQRKSHNGQPNFYPLFSPSLLIKRWVGLCIKRMKRKLHGRKARAAGSEEVKAVVSRDAWDSWGCEQKEAGGKKGC